MAADTVRSVTTAEKTEGELELDRLFKLQQDAFAQNPYPSYEERIENLDKILRIVDTYEDKFIEAINADFNGRSKFVTVIAEITGMIGSVKHAKKHLRKWMKPRAVPTPIHMAPAKSRLMPQPLGVVGCIAPWNYPLLLAVAPAISALAAGNRVLMKPSELTPNLSAVLKEAVAHEFEEETLAVITGGVDTGQAFTNKPFDHIIFTGSTQIGALVAQAAAKNLTPVTLELGGKSPAIIDKTAELEKAAISIAHGKMLNAGQTCIAPDYILTDAVRVQHVADAIKAAALSLFPEIDTTADYTSIISDRHFARLKALVENAREAGAEIIEVGSAQALHPQRKMPLTLVLNPPAHTHIMKEEIFGPVLPILSVEGTQGAIDHVNAHERPLALYWFGENDEARDNVLKRTVAGGVTINDTLWHFAQENLPFGGVGKSGMGANHGAAGFDAFSHMKPVFYQSRFVNGGLLYPPYTEKTGKLLSFIRKIL